MKISDIYSAYMYSYPHKTAYRKLENVNFSDYKRLLMDSRGSLYFHIPFCRTKCGYCNLFSVTGRSDDYMAEYISACELQLKQYDVPIDCFDSLIVGGGDPMSLPAALLHRLLSLSAGKIRLDIETSPGGASADKLSVLKELGTNRVSIGVQSFFDSELESLQRAHSARAAKKALHLIKSYGFPSVNIDLIYGIHGQTAATLEKSLKQALDFEPDEIFIYPLYIRKSTGLSGQTAGESRYEMYNLARDYLRAGGYSQLSMRRFTRGAPASFKSCGFENMLAIGCGGRSYLGNLHFCRPFAVEQSKCVPLIDDFIKNDNKTEINHGYILGDDEQKRRYVIKNLLHYAGVSSAEYRSIFGRELSCDFPQIADLLLRGYALEQGDFIRLSPLGMSLSDYIGPMFISQAVKDKMASWKGA